jgi:TM2 domain-containing membrane protein YozV
MNHKHKEEKTPKHARKHARHKLEASLSEDDKSMVSSLIKKKGKVPACPNCGGLDLSDPPGGEKASKTGIHYCIDCGFIGEPKNFDHEKAYEKFFSFKREKYNEGLDEVAEKKHRPVAQLKAAPAGKPWVAAWLSVFMPGLGQAYNTQLIKGATLAIIYLLMIFSLYSVFVEYDGILPQVHPIMAAALLILVYASGDAYIVSLRRSKATC